MRSREPCASILSNFWAFLFVCRRERFVPSLRRSLAACSVFVLRSFLPSESPRRAELLASAIRGTNPRGNTPGSGRRGKVMRIRSDLDLAVQSREPWPFPLPQQTVEKRHFGLGAWHHSTCRNLPSLVCRAARSLAGRGVLLAVVAAFIGRLLRQHASDGVCNSRVHVGFWHE